MAYLEHNCYNIIADVSFALHLLHIADSVRQQCRHVEHDLTATHAHIYASSQCLDIPVFEHRVHTLIARLSVCRV
jgi:hypothetical protein